MTDRTKRAAIIGAGIAGLSAALCLSRKGFCVDIMEQADSLTEAGAGLQLSPNATRILDRLGVLGRLSAEGMEPESIDLVSGVALTRIASVPAGAFARDRWHAPYLALSRSSLQSALLHAVLADPACRLHTGIRVSRAARAEIASVTGTAPDLIIGADGRNSLLRPSMDGTGTVSPTGLAAWRLIVPEANAPACLDPLRVTAFVGPGAHLVAYPMGGARGFNIVAIAPVKNAGAAQASAVAAALSGWHANLRALLDRPGDGLGLWPLATVSDGRWQDGQNRVLIGDAAHAMTPFAAQGAAMAIEDGFELASFVSRGMPQGQAIAAFEAHRRPRIERVRRRAAFNRFAYHARGPFRIGRDIVLSLRTPEQLAADFDWLYGYEAAD